MKRTCCNLKPIDTLKKYRIFAVILLIMISCEAFSQKDSLKVTHNVVYLEILGVGGYGSINYERQIYHKQFFTLAMRFGLSSFHIKDYENRVNPDMLIPLSIKGYYGETHKIECGIGETFSSLIYADLNEFKPKRANQFHGHFSIGYRYQKNKGGIIFGCAYTPIVENNRYYRHWAGISLGYSF